MSTIATADLWDQYSDKLELLNLELLSYGTKTSFAGEVVTLKLYEDNTYVRKVLSEEGTGKALVIDGGGSRRCALIGDNIASLAMENQWAGVVVYGCIRDSAVINNMDICIKAIGTCPVKSIKRDVGIRGEKLVINGTSIQQGDYLYADSDGVLISHENLL